MNEKLEDLKKWKYSLTIWESSNYFKGVSSKSEYRYSKRIIKAMPCYQLSEPFEAGENFFGMVNHYLHMREDIENEITINPIFFKIKNVLESSDGTSGFELTKRLFYCSLLAYYDRFGNFDIRAISKLCLWAFTIRLDMEHLSGETINNYAIGRDTQNRYTNKISMFFFIKNSHSHLDIANMLIKKNLVGNTKENLRNNLNQL